MEFAPIVLFVYNRPMHTLNTLNALAKNLEAKESELFIYCDGPKSEPDLENIKKINKVLEIAKGENRFKKVTIKIQNKNQGLAKSIIQGVSEVVENYGKVIVLEDDILTGKYFLKFMNEALVIYKNEKRVYGVSGFTFPSKKIKDSTYFLPIMSSWGYGTWNDRWTNINFSGKELLFEVSSKRLENKLDFGYLKYYKMLEDQVTGKNDSWAVRFYVSMFLNKGVFLFPNLSLLKNIGFDGTGIHCNIDKSKIHFGDYINNLNIPVKKMKISLNKKIIRKIKKGEVNTNKTIVNRIKKKIKGVIAPELIQLGKRKRESVKRNQDNFINLPRYTKTKIKLKGHEITVPDNASYQFMYKEIFEENIYQFNTLNLTPYIIDGGANIGLASIYFKLLYPNAKIVAFEPDLEIFNILSSNIMSFGFTDIELVQKGLWNDISKLSFHSEGADAGLITDVNETHNPTESIDVTSLNPYLHEPVDLLKLDIEGSETIVLKDIESNLNQVKRIFVEYHSFTNKPQSLNEIIEILTKAKFRLYMSIPGNSAISSPFMGLRSYNNMDFQLNIFGFKKSE